MSQLKGKKVLITGGASGIGRLMGKIVLQKGAELIIWDINPTSISETFAELQILGKVYTYQLDVSDINQIKQTAAKVKSDCGRVDILINNAGIVVGKYFDEHTTEEIKRTMEINASAPMYISSEFLPDMIAGKLGISVILLRRQALFPIHACRCMQPANGQLLVGRTVFGSK